MNPKVPFPVLPIIHVSSAKDIPLSMTPLYVTAERQHCVHSLLSIGTVKFSKLYRDVVNKKVIK